MIEYQNKTDEELIALNRAGDEEAAAALLYRYRALVKGVARQFYMVVGGDSDDLVQEGMIALNSAIFTYDGGKNASFKTFASRCVKCKIIDVIRASQREKRKPLEAEEQIESDDAVEWLLGKERYELMQRAVKDALNDDELALFKLYLGGFSYAEIAGARTLSVKQVDNSLQKIKNKLKKALKNSDYLLNS